MFKPECILDTVALFGIPDTVKLVKAKFMRLGKSARVAETMAYALVINTVFVAE